MYIDPNTSQRNNLVYLHSGLQLTQPQIKKPSAHGKTRFAMFEFDMSHPPIVHLKYELCI